MSAASDHDVERALDDTLLPAAQAYPVPLAGRFADVAAGRAGTDRRGHLRQLALPLDKERGTTLSLPVPLLYTVFTGSAGVSARNTAIPLPVAASVAVPVVTSGPVTPLRFLTAASDTDLPASAAYLLTSTVTLALSPGSTAVAIALSRGQDPAALFSALAAAMVRFPITNGAWSAANSVSNFSAIYPLLSALSVSNSAADMPVTPPRADAGAIIGGIAGAFALAGLIGFGCYLRTTGRCPKACGGGGYSAAPQTPANANLTPSAGRGGGPGGGDRQVATLGGTIRGDGDGGVQLAPPRRGPGSGPGQGGRGTSHIATLSDFRS